MWDWVEENTLPEGGWGDVYNSIPEEVRIAALDGLLNGGDNLSAKDAVNASPMALALFLAQEQRGDINPFLTRMNALQGEIAGNQSPYIRSLTDPYDLETSSQRSALMSSLGQRGVLGSSFGNMDIGNFNHLRDSGRSGLVSQGLNSSIAMQTGLLGDQLEAVNKRNLGTNLLLGLGLDASGRMFNRGATETKTGPDKFGLSATDRLIGWGLDKVGDLF